MGCKKCKEKPVITLISSVSLCKSCFIKYFEKKVFKTINKFNLIGKKEKIAVAVSGGKDSLTCLYLLNKLALTKKDLELVAILIDEGIKGYRDITIKDAVKFCKENKIELKIYSFKKEFGYTLDELVKKLNLKPCTICGAFRRYLLNIKSRELKANKLATGHNLDDEAQSILMNQFKNNIEISARLGPLTGVIKDKRFIPRIKPLYLMTEKETTLYAFFKNLRGEFVECKYSYLAYRNDVRDFLNNFEAKYPGIKYGIVNSFLEILPLLKQKYKISTEIKACKICYEPCAQEICKACQLVKKLKS